MKKCHHFDPRLPKTTVASSFHHTIYLRAIWTQKQKKLSRLLSFEFDPRPGAQLGGEGRPPTPGPQGGRKKSKKGEKRAKMSPKKH